jgi:hypothetical protein
MRLRGPGKYDDLATMVRHVTGASGVVLFVFNGASGDGVAVQCTPESMVSLADALEEVANRIRDDLRHGGTEPS